MRKIMNLKLNKLFLCIVLVNLVFIFSACGENSLNLTESKYEPKIVINGYLYPGKPVRDIKLTRNFPLGESINLNSMSLSDADVSLDDLSEGKSYRLSFDPSSMSFDYSGQDLIIHSGRSYRLNVSARVNGKSLFASSTTLVPRPGLRITGINYPSLKYREKSQDGTLKKFGISFLPSPDAVFYGISINALDAAVENFIKENPYVQPTQEDLLKNFNSHKYQYDWIQNVSQSTLGFSYMPEWLSIWFYGNYELVIYAGDRNFFDYLASSNSIQEADGNFHQPVMHIQGDGIGVFGSAVADTIHFKVTH